MLSTLFLATLLAGAEAPGTLTIEVFEKDSAGKESPVPARVHFTGPDGKPVKPSGRPSDPPRVLGPSLPFFHDHWSTPGTLSLELPPGKYAFLVERGPEYRRASGKVEVSPGGKQAARVALERWVGLASKGWWCGDTHVHRPIEELPLILDAEDLNVAPAITVWNKNNLWKSRPLPEKLLVEPSPGRAIHLLACEDERKGGALLFFNVSTPLDFASDGPEHPSPVQHLSEAVEKQGAWAEIEKPFWWDVPETFRFAATAPFYAEVGSSPRTVHRKDVEYFLRWIDERIEALARSADLPDPEKRESVLAPHRSARKEFEKLLEWAVP